MWRICRIIICFSVCCTVSNVVYSQSDWMEWKSEITDERSAEKWENQYQELVELAEHPFNINTITKEQLEQLPFLSEQLIENILYYLYKYGPMVSKNELLGVEGMDYQTRRFLNDFIYIGPTEKKESRFSWKKLFKYNKQDLFIRVDIPFNQKAGYVHSLENQKKDKQYLGNSLYQNVRYKFQYKKQVYWGLVAEKDPGEPFFQGENKKGYDFYSMYFYLQDVGRLKNLAVGNYRASFGYGLVMNMDFSMGKSSMAGTINRFGRGISKYTSTNESNYLQGVAATYKLNRRWNASLFYSFRKLDATINNMLISTLKTDGYHRLHKDFLKKNVVDNHLIGGNLQYNGKYFEGGLTTVYNHFDKLLKPAERPYNKYYPRGQNFSNTGVYAKWFLRKFILSGEVAVDKNGAIAALQSLSYSPCVNTTLVVINRYYDKKYQSLYADGFRENTHTQNEIGSYIGLETNMFRRFSLSSYFDFFYFPWKRYRVDRPKSMGFEGMLQIGYSPTYSLNMFIKYNYKNKAQNFTTPSKVKYVIPYIRQRLHYQLNYAPNEQIQLKTYVEGTFTSHWKQDRAKGYLVGFSGKWGRERFPIKCSLSGAWFDTDNYDTRSYIYEPGLIYAYSMYSFYGKGTRLAVNLNYSLGKWFFVQAKWGWTHYLDRTTISSGLEEIRGSNKSDLQLQLKLKW